MDEYDDWEDEYDDDWDYLTEALPHAFNGAMKNFDRVEESLGKPVRNGVPLWYGLVGDYPSAIEVTGNSDYEEVFITTAPVRVLTRNDTYLCVEGYPRAHVLGLHIQDIDGPHPYISAVKAHQAPEWGMWLPWLKEPF